MSPNAAPVAPSSPRDLDLDVLVEVTGGDPAGDDEQSPRGAHQRLRHREAHQRREQGGQARGRSRRGACRGPPSREASAAIRSVTFCSSVTSASSASSACSISSSTPAMISSAAAGTRGADADRRERALALALDPLDQIRLLGRLVAQPRRARRRGELGEPSRTPSSRRRPRPRLASNSFWSAEPSARCWKRSPSNWRQLESRSDLDGRGLRGLLLGHLSGGAELADADDAEDRGEDPERRRGR